MTDNNFLETIKMRVSDAQRRWTEAQHKLQVAQQEFQTAQMEFSNWQGVLNAEMRHLGIAQPVQPARPLPQPQARIITVGQPQQAVVQTPPIPTPTPPATAQPTTTQPNSPSGQQSEVNKTELIRELLQQHPAGMSPLEIWTALKDEVTRDYVYAVLKRLKDRNQIVFQRKRRKYFMRVPQKPEDTKEQTLLQ